MKLRDLLREVFDEDGGVERISVFLPDGLLKACNITLESAWQESDRKGWIYRVDPEDPNLPQQRHVHIARSKHKSSKNMQASWNADGTRHDKKSFNGSVGNMNFVRQLARDVLKMPSNITLENYGSKEISITDDGVKLSEDRTEAYIRFLIEV